MPVNQDVFRFHTIVPVRFGRAAEGPPQADVPEVDDRGHAGPEPEPAVGVTEGDTVKVGVLRAGIEDAPEVRLYAVSGSPDAVAIHAPPHGLLPPGPLGVFQLRALAGGEGIEARRAWVEVHAGGPTGPLLSRLAVHVFRPLALNLVLHPVRIKGATGEASSAADLKAVLALVRAVWRPCGIAVLSGVPRRDEAVFARAGTVADGPWSPAQGLKNTEIDRLLATGAVPEAVNAYFVRKLSSGAGVQGFTRRAAAAFQLRGPGIVVAETDASGKDRDPYDLANDLCHEIGHFLGLPHPDRRAAPREREDGWSRRMLMHNHNPLLGRDPWPRRSAAGEPYLERPLLEDAGYGPLKRGCLVTIRHVPRLAADGECLRARRTLVQPGGVY